MKLQAKLASAGVCLAAAIYLTPWVVYAIGLSMVEGRPLPPAQKTFSYSERQYLQREFRIEGRIVIHRQSPWSYALALASGNYKQLHAGGSQVAWVVARHHNLQHQKDKGMSRWHLSGAALTIWLTRHWSSDQILAAAAEIARNERWRSNNALQWDVPAFGGSAPERGR